MEMDTEIRGRVGKLPRNGGWVVVCVGCGGGGALTGCCEEDGEGIKATTTQQNDVLRHTSL